MKLNTSKTNSTLFLTNILVQKYKFRKIILNFITPTMLILSTPFIPLFLMSSYPKHQTFYNIKCQFCRQKLSF